MTTEKQLKVKREKPKSRPQQWSEATAAAVNALHDLVSLQEEYQNWLDNLPENLQSGTLADKLQAVVDLDLASALDAAEEANNADLPRGFGRD